MQWRNLSFPKRKKRKNCSFSRKNCSFIFCGYSGCYTHRFPNISVHYKCQNVNIKQIYWDIFSRISHPNKANAQLLILIFTKHCWTFSRCRFLLTSGQGVPFFWHFFSQNHFVAQSVYLITLLVPFYLHPFRFWTLSGQVVRTSCVVRRWTGDPTVCWKRSSYVTTESHPPFPCTVGELLSLETELAILSSVLFSIFQ